jgi:hypothetical protein
MPWKIGYPGTLGVGGGLNGWNKCAARLLKYLPQVSFALAYPHLEHVGQADGDKLRAELARLIAISCSDASKLPSKCFAIPNCHFPSRDLRRDQNRDRSRDRSRDWSRSCAPKLVCAGSQFRRGEMGEGCATERCSMGECLSRRQYARGIRFLFDQGAWHRDGKNRQPA